VTDDAVEQPQPMVLGVGLELVTPLGHEGTRGKHVVQHDIAPRMDVIG
jgi:hypothetical protein